MVSTSQVSNHMFDNARDPGKAPGSQTDAESKRQITVSRYSDPHGPDTMPLPGDLPDVEINSYDCVAKGGGTGRATVSIYVSTEFTEFNTSKARAIARVLLPTSPMMLPALVVIAIDKHDGGTTYTLQKVSLSSDPRETVDILEQVAVTVSSRVTGDSNE